MAQGQHKAKNAASQLVKIVKSKNRIQRGQRITPKSIGALKEKAMQKKLSARNIQNTEIQMSIKAASTGKLTIMKSISDKAISDKKEKDKLAKKK